MSTPMHRVDGLKFSPCDIPRDHTATVDRLLIRRKDSTLAAVPRDERSEHIRAIFNAELERDMDDARQYLLGEGYAGVVWSCGGVSLLP